MQLNFRVMHISSSSASTLFVTTGSARKRKHCRTVGLAMLTCFLSALLFHQPSSPTSDTHFLQQESYDVGKHETSKNIQDTRQERDIDSDGRQQVSHEAKLPVQPVSQTNGTMELSAMNCSYMSWYESTSKPMWIPGYPGSGSEMLRALVKAITGLSGEDIYRGSHCSNHTATCKTHWPKFPDRYIPSTLRHDFINRTVLLIRNPKDALPSFHNHMWEGNNGKDLHSVQAPEEDWNKWRDRFSRGEIISWVGLIRRWKHLTDYKISFYLPYERLTDREAGPQLLLKLAEELRRNGVRVAPKEDIPCLWYKVVKGRKSSSKTKRAHKYVPSYKLQQQANLLYELEKLKEDFKDDSELVEILAKYQEDIRSNLQLYSQPKNTSNANVQ